MWFETCSCLHSSPFVFRGLIPEGITQRNNIMMKLAKFLITVALTVVAILVLSRYAIKDYQRAISKSRNAAANDGSTTANNLASPGSTAGGDYVFEGDLGARMSKNTTTRPTPAEDQQRAREAAFCVRVVFDPETHPRFAEMAKAALLKRWNQDLGYQLVFAESRGPLEEAATAVTLRLKIQLYTTDFQYANQPDLQQFFRAVDLIGYRNQREVSTSWDNLNFSASKEFPRQFKLGLDKVEKFNRQRLGYLYQELA